ncbi:flavin reductase (DIM6/NTAB) family NADH-FMN oxidoreductase RutF [Naumannella halotolerans]|uniref:Flavin reductase (DIM6/NTAB) family NADH-FMN oxidoreductase RutF n=2 Tax=Naumannella halotolerans TaxID=993414 RepID=A0A4R7IYU8_9ACTN|nr:flavin reductase (DIM6/NTAB) family NADH-FMN oxidoreductase RutF [Naumannella halotolerans]
MITSLRNEFWDTGQLSGSAMATTVTDQESDHVLISTHTADPTALRSAFAGFPSGVAALAAVVDGETQVLLASSFTVGVSQDPPLVLFAVQHSSSTWPQLRQAAHLGVSVLGSRHAERARQLAGKDRSRRLLDIDHQVQPSGALLLEHSPVWLECMIENEYPAGDHDIIVLRVEAMATDDAHSPLVWHRRGFLSLTDPAAADPRDAVG